MKILFYIHSLGIGGAEAIVTDYLLELKQRGINVVLVVNNRCDSFWEQSIIDNEIKIYELYNNISNIFIRKIDIVFHNVVLKYKKKWNVILELEKPDLIHIHTWTDTLDGINFPYEKMIYTFHADVERSLELSSKRNVKLLQQLSDSGMGFSAVSTKAKDDIRRIFNTQKVIVLPNAVNLKEIRSTVMCKENFCKENHIPENSFIVGHVGRFHPVKNHERIIDIFSEIKKNKNNAFLVLVGGDVDGRKDKINAYVESLGLSDYVIFMGIRKDATKIMSVFDVFLLPSYAESFSVVTVEAQALYKKCVVSDCLPDEVVCTDKCIRVSLDEGNNVWATTVIENNTVKQICDIDNLDISSVIEKLIDYYIFLLK